MTYVTDEMRADWAAETERYEKRERFKEEAEKRLEDVLDEYVRIQALISSLEGAEGLWAKAPGDLDFVAVGQLATHLGDAARLLKKAAWRLTYYADGKQAERSRDVIERGRWREDLLAMRDRDAPE